MFTVIERWHSRKYHGVVTRFPSSWVVWCGWCDEWSAEWSDKEEALRDAALKEWHYEHR